MLAAWLCHFIHDDAEIKCDAPTLHHGETTVVMSALAQFHFIRPSGLLLFIPLIWLVWQTWRQTRQTHVWTKLCDSHLLPYLLMDNLKKTSYLPCLLLGLIGSLIIVALAGPAWQKLPQTTYQSVTSTVFLLDLSKSMDSPDVAPSRLSRAKLKLLDMLDKQQEGQSALIVYAFEPHVVSPLTDDAKTMAAMVSVLSTDLMPIQGSRIEDALQKAQDLLQQAGVTHGNIIVLTDGVSGDAAIAMAQQSKNNQYFVSVLAVGTAEGAPIPAAGGGFVKDRQGGIVIPATNFALLKEFTLAGGGRFSRLSVDDTDINKVMVASANGSNKFDDSKQSDREIDVWREEGPWLVLLVLPLLAFGFRRGWLTSIVFCCVVALPPAPVYAFEWNDLWVSKDQQATQLMEQGNPEQAAQRFENLDWQGTAHYKSGDYTQAAAAFSQSTAISSDFNLGNALAHSGKLAEAIAAYDAALSKNPNDKDTQFNKALIEALLKQQQKKSDPQNSDQEQSDKADQDKTGQDKTEQNKNSSENKDQQQQAENNQDNQQSDQSSPSSPSDDNQDGNQQQAQNANADSQTDENENSGKSQANAAEQNQLEQPPAQSSNEPNEIDEEQQAMAQQPSKETNDPNDPAQPPLSTEQVEAAQAIEQWLKRIPDDPGGLLRQKFLLQHQRRQSSNTSAVEQW